LVRNTNLELEHSATASESLQIIAKTLALIALRMGPEANATLNDRAAFLASLGFDTKTIAGMLDTSVTTIAPMLSRRKAQGKPRRSIRKARK
jgi:hypothetical protein